jgi:drug/metabolite transporter (DMT)-like permease
METTDQEKHIPRKPIQVTYAFYLILGAIAVTLVGSMITRVLSEQASLSELLAGTASVGLVLLLPLWLAFKINAGRNWARWGFVIFAVLGLFDTLNLLSSFSDHPIQSTYYAISVGLSFFAIFLLFQPPANVWFKVIKINESIPEETQTV